MAEYMGCRCVCLSCLCAEDAALGAESGARGLSCQVQQTLLFLLSPQQVLDELRSNGQDLDVDAVQVVKAAPCSGQRKPCVPFTVDIHLVVML